MRLIAIIDYYVKTKSIYIIIIIKYNIYIFFFNITSMSFSQSVEIKSLLS